MKVETKGLKNFQHSSSAWGQRWSSCGGSTRMIEREETTFFWPLSLAQETLWDRPVDPFSKEQFPGQDQHPGWAGGTQHCTQHGPCIPRDCAPLPAAGGTGGTSLVLGRAQASPQEQRLVFGGC